VSLGVFEMMTFGPMALAIISQWPPPVIRTEYAPAFLASSMSLRTSGWLTLCFLPVLATVRPRFSGLSATARIAFVTSCSLRGFRCGPLFDSGLVQVHFGRDAR
jgi:hypothetical protein